MPDDPPSDERRSADSFEQLRSVWQNLGGRDPMWAVLSDPDKLGGRWDRDEFFLTGEHHVESLMSELDRRGLAAHRGRCLDFGCGVGRLTQPLTEHFDHVDGVDIAGSMIDRARELNRRGDRCTFHLNDAPDLGLFTDDSFDLVVSFIVLQHVPPDLVRAYLPELVRVTRPGGALVFQLPSEPRPEVPAESLPPEAFRAGIRMVGDPPTVVRPGQRFPIAVEVANEGGGVWPARVAGPGPFHVRVGTRWLTRSGRSAPVAEGRRELPMDVDPGASVGVGVNVTAPRESGPHRLVVDVVQEEVAWFGDRGSRPVTMPVRVTWTVSGIAWALGRAPVAVLRRIPPLRRVARTIVTRARAGRATAGDHEPPGEDELFDMHGLPHAEVKAILRRCGAPVVDAEEDGFAGPHWVSYTYYAQRSDATRRVEIRVADPAEYERIGRLTLDAYLTLWPGGVGTYDEVILDVAGRAATDEVWVAVVDDEVVGSLTYVADPDSPSAQWDDPDAVGFRLLAVSVDHQGSGAGRALFEAVLERARADGRARVRLHSHPLMAAALRMYSDAGFVRDPTTDFVDADDEAVVGYVLRL